MNMNGKRLSPVSKTDSGTSISKMVCGPQTIVGSASTLYSERGDTPSRIPVILDDIKHRSDLVVQKIAVIGR